MFRVQAVLDGRQHHERWPPKLFGNAPCSLSFSGNKSEQSSNISYAQLRSLALLTIKESHVIQSEYFSLQRAWEAGSPTLIPCSVARHELFLSKSVQPTVCSILPSGRQHRGAQKITARDLRWLRSSKQTFVARHVSPQNTGAARLPLDHVPLFTTGSV